MKCTEYSCASPFLIIDFIFSGVLNLISDLSSSMFENISTGKVQVRHGLLQFADLKVHVIALASSMSAINTEILGINVMKFSLIQNSISFNSRIGRNMILQHR